MSGPSFPDRVVMCMDDITVRGILVQLGVLARLDFPPESTVNVAHYSVDDHPTHWVLVSRFRNFPGPEENGYTLVGWPKNLVTVDEANELARDVMLDRGFQPKRLAYFRSGAPVPQS